jgi:hypothetical protein
MNIELIESLGDDDWLEPSKQITKLIKPEIQQSPKDKGLAKRCRDSFEQDRQYKLSLWREKFIDEFNIDDLDNQINDYCNGIYRINKYIDDYINLNLLNYVHDNKAELISDYPNTSQLVSYLLSQENNNSITKFRLHSVFNQVVFGSTRQSGVSNAGIAGEEFVDAILASCGLNEGIDYKRQHKSNTYSDTDFVLPWVEDYRDQDVQIFAAVQFSSNDRIRMVGGELKSGAQAVAITGSGLDSSSKNLDTIGANILAGMMEKNHQLVCYQGEIERMIEKHENKVKMVKKDGTKPKSVAGNETKLTYFKEYAISFSEFAKTITERFKSS